MGWEKRMDVSVAVGMVLFAVWMALTSRSVSAAGGLLFSSTAVLRLRSPRVRRWTDENRWRFLAIMVPVLLLTVLGAMPTG
jgi:multisubunit Na+/H+ antiporter MnhE subunit